MGTVMSRKRTFTYILLLMMLQGSLHADELMIGQFSHGDLNGWQEKSFVGHTQYQIITTDHGKALQAKSQNSASGLFKEITIDLRKTPWLNWSWRIDNIYSGNDERSKQGDDYPARIYVVVSGGLLFWKTRAINYVWSSNQSINSEWSNAYTRNAKMIAVQTGNTQIGQWLSQKRNIRDDLKKIFGEDIDEIHAIAVMTDSDNTGQSATALYGDLFFTRQ